MFWLPILLPPNKDFVFTSGEIHSYAEDQHKMCA